MTRTTPNKRLFWALPVLLMGSACSTPKLAKLEVPDGRHRRPANPYGTVLPSVDAMAGTVVAPTRPIPTAAPEPTMVFPTPGPPVPASSPDSQVPALETDPKPQTPSDAQGGPNDG